MDMGCPLLRESSDRRLRRRAATIAYNRKIILFDCNVFLLCIYVHKVDT